MKSIVKAKDAAYGMYMYHVHVPCTCTCVDNLCYTHACVSYKINHQDYGVHNLQILTHGLHQRNEPERDIRMVSSVPRIIFW